MNDGDNGSDFIVNIDGSNKYLNFINSSNLNNYNLENSFLARIEHVLNNGTDYLLVYGLNNEGNDSTSVPGDTYKLKVNFNGQLNINPNFYYTNFTSTENSGVYTYTIDLVLFKEITK